MKITGTGSPVPPEATSEATASETKGVGGKDFAEKLDRSGAAATGVEAAGASTGAARAGTTSAVGEIGADLKAGRVSPEAALEQVIDRILDRQLGPGAPPAVREQVEAALRDALESDPLLAEKMRVLSSA